jgi:hypothetical protein
MASKTILLVEGTDDEHVAKALMGRHGVARIDLIKSCGGYTNLLEAFPVRILESDINALGVIIDADADIDARWQAIRGRIVKHPYPDVPATPPREGLVLNAPDIGGLPRLGIWLMPDNTVPGILEDFIRYLVPRGNALFEYANRCVEGIPSPRLFSRLDLPKVRIHTWLAWQSESGRPLGQSITSRALDAASPQAVSFISWIRRLYYPDSGDTATEG